MAAIVQGIACKKWSFVAFYAGLKPEACIVKWSGICLLVCLSLVSVCGHSDVFKWTDAQGRVRYGDKLPANSKAEDISDKITINSFEGAEVSPNDFFDAVEEARAEQTRNQKKRVVMYSTEWCGVCKRARRYFQQHSIPFREYDVEKSERGKQDYARLQGRGVPIILVGKRRMNGFSAERFEQMYRGKF